MCKTVPDSRLALSGAEQLHAVGRMGWATHNPLPVESAVLLSFAVGVVGALSSLLQ